MYSDKWLMEGYSTSDRYRLKIGEPIDYYLWFDKNKRPIGVAINFEYADDSHCELKYGDFLKLITVLGDGEDFIAILGEYFKKNGRHEFSEFLSKNNIPFKQINFCDPTDC